jgi:hypothetical protein
MKVKYCRSMISVIDAPASTSSARHPMQAAVPTLRDHVDDSALGLTHAEARPAAVVLAGSHAQQVGQDPLRRLERGLGHHHRVQPSRRVLRRNPSRAVPARARVAGRGDQVDHQAVGIAQREDLLASTVHRVLGIHSWACRRCHQPGDSGGTVNAVAVVRRVLLRPAGTPRRGKNVRIVDQRPTALP